MQIDGVYLLDKFGKSIPEPTPLQQLLMLLQMHLYDMCSGGTTTLAFSSGRIYGPIFEKDGKRYMQEKDSATLQQFNNKL